MKRPGICLAFAFGAVAPGHLFALVLLFFHQGRAGNLVDVVFDRDALAIGLVDATGQLDEGIGEGLRGLMLAQGQP